MKPQNNASRPSTKAALSEESLSELVDVVCRHPLHRELYLKLLGFCTEERTVDEAEIFLEAQPEYADALQTSTVLVNVLIDHGGLEYEEYDETGEKLTEARIEGFREQGLSEGEIYDAIERRCVRATEEGRAVTNLLDPVKRVRSYLASDPSRTEALLKLLAFCSTPRTLEEINELFDGDPALAPRERTSWQRVHASYLIDRMKEAGGLCWDGGWRTTPAGTTAAELF